MAAYVGRVLTNAACRYQCERYCSDSPNCQTIQLVLQARLRAGNCYMQSKSLLMHLSCQLLRSLTIH